MNSVLRHLIVLTATALVAPAPALARLGDRTLHRGMRGADVRELQRALTALRLRTTIDGAFGARTQVRVRAYERRYHERQDGSVSRPEGRRIATRAHRAKALRALPAGFGRRLLRRGARGADVRYLQSLLGRLGYPTAADGVFGAETESKVRAWELSVHGQVDGRVSSGQANEMRRRAPAESRADLDSGAHYVFPIRGSHSYGTSVNRYGAARSGHSHGGQDILAPGGTRLVAVTDGRVWATGHAGGAGNYVVIAGGDHRDYAYYHLQSSATVREGQLVTPGTTVGRVGCTGDCTGDHLHFEIWTPHWWDGGHNYDPLPTLRHWDRSS